jgi:hypothetical protein
VGLSCEIRPGRKGQVNVTGPTSDSIIQPVEPDAPFNARLLQAIAAVDAANAEAPKTIEIDGRPLPAELVYGWRMSETLARLEPNPSDCLRIAARGQHVGRWRVPRNTFAAGRAGYLAWRKHQRNLQAVRLGQIMAAAGYAAVDVGRVGQLIRKERLKLDPEVQMLEDVICVVFLQHYFDAFAPSIEHDKLADILAKTWLRMSEYGRAHALKLNLPPIVPELLARGMARRLE